MSIDRSTELPDSDTTTAAYDAIEAAAASSDIHPPANPSDAHRPTPSLWRNRGFLQFWAGQSISQLGDQVTSLALPLIAVLVLRASTAEVAALTALSWTPSLLGIFLGAWIDGRQRKRPLLVAADLGRAVVLLSLPAAYAFGRVTLVQLYLVALLAGAISILFNTAYRAFFVRIVAQESYIDANSKISSSQAVASVAGPALGGALIQALSAPVAVVVDALSFLASAAFIGRIQVDESATATEPATTPTAAAATSPTPTPTDEPIPLSFGRRIKEGWTFVIQDPIMRGSLGCSTTINFFTFVAGTGLLVLFANRDLGLSAGVIGLAFGLGAIGSFLGAVLSPRVARRIGVGGAMGLGSVLFPAAIALAAAAGGPVWLRVLALAGSEFLAGIGVMLFDVNQNSIMTVAVSEGLRSRVAGVYSTVNYGVRPLGALIGGALGTLAGLRVTLLVGAVGGTLGALWVLASPIPKIRTLDDIGALQAAHQIPQTSN